MVKRLRCFSMAVDIMSIFIKDQINIIYTGVQVIET